MKDYKITEMILFVFGYMMISTLIFVAINNFISMWLGINVGLAIIPLLLITLAYIRLEKEEFRFDWLAIVLLIGFVFFFPNTFYVVTDLIHIGQIDFYNTQMYENTIYFRNIEDYIFLFHVVITVFIGVYAGIKSMLRLNLIFEKINLDKGSKGTLLFVLVFLSAIGIYIGRFLRFFSWDILRPFKLLGEFFDSIDFFAVQFVILFVIIQFIFYYGYRMFYEKEPF